MNSQPLTAQKEVLGYTLIERIGSGGFGEVWAATAPGGLRKALKIVYGFHDEKRAQAELKALDRVKELRHPFLLSLERIEIFEDQLVVVTELADNSLADVFNEFVVKGEPGIPRDELVKYMKCAADALDYMSTEQNLQHLDVKPENLLLVSGHVKVADFGLIKDLENASQSLMSGMTPAYAAPELFDGRPGLFSDQYSLAIVYQEMLTGIRPFPGNTPAQLAAQHMHGKPNLRPLPKGDQPVIAKALSKDPNVRYKNCSDMIEELSYKKRSVKKAIRRTQTPRTVSDTESNTIQFDDKTLARDVTAVMSGTGLPFQSAEIEALDPPDCEGETANLRPTLIVSVGATANRVVQKIKKQIVCRHGSVEAVPSIRLLTIDTDRQALGEMRMVQGSESMLGDEIVEIPLRKPEVYREKSKSHLTWLSRRWIYNVPRSLQTEGLRPLGRLAFADHFESICERIQSVLGQITLPENLAQSADTLDLDPGELHPRVYIVTSISGGIGSGMALDLAYTIKLLMHESGLPTDSVSGILLHSTYQRSRDPGLSAANSFAFMTELRHFVENGFPGDESIGLPDFEDEPPFDYTYFNDLGNDLRQSEFEEKLDKIAEYIYLSSASKCSVFFDQCRALEEEIDHFALRTFGICSTGPGNLTMGEIAVRRVSRGLIRRWISGDQDSDFDAVENVQSEFENLDLVQDKVIEKMTETAQVILGDQLTKLSDKAHQIALSSNGNVTNELNEHFDNALGCPPARRDTSHIDPAACLEMEELVGKEATVVGDQLATQIINLIEENQMKLHSSRQSVELSGAKLEALRKELEQASSQCESNLAMQLSRIVELATEKGRSKASEVQRLSELVDQFCSQRFQEFVMRFAKLYYRGVANSLNATTDMIKRYVEQMETIHAEFDSSDEIEEAEDRVGFSMDRLLSDSIDQETHQHILQTEAQVYEALIKERGGYLAILNEPSTFRKQMPVQIRLSAQQVLADAYRKVSLEKVIAQNNVGPEQLVRWLSGRITDARPQVDDCGGASRMMIGLPELTGDSVLPEIFEKQFNLKSCTIKGTQGNFVICFEGENIALANVAYRLLEARPDAIELVKRIQTRNDVEWTTLDDLL